MIETTAQAQAAIAEIGRLTNWPDAEIARRADVHRATMHRIKSGAMKFPGYKTRLALYDLLKYARSLTDEVE
jgi:predicted DNA-binding protein YlxM (UPF0122 family)